MIFLHSLEIVKLLYLKYIYFCIDYMNKYCQFVLGTSFETKLALLETYCVVLSTEMWTDVYRLQLDSNDKGKRQLYPSLSWLKAFNFLRGHGWGFTYRNIGDSKATLTQKDPHSMGDNSQTLCPWSTMSNYLPFLWSLSRVGMDFINLVSFLVSWGLPFP